MPFDIPLRVVTIQHPGACPLAPATTSERDRSTSYRGSMNVGPPSRPASRSRGSYEHFQTRPPQYDDEGGGSHEYSPLRRPPDPGWQRVNNSTQHCRSRSERYRVGTCRSLIKPDSKRRELDICARPRLILSMQRTIFVHAKAEENGIVWRKSEIVRVCPMCQEELAFKDNRFSHFAIHAIESSNGDFSWKCPCGEADGYWPTEIGAAAGMTEHFARRHGIPQTVSMGM